MRDTNGSENRWMMEVFGGRLLLLLFGLGTLGFLVAANRTEWFAIRPATGTSIAMANAANTATAANTGAALGKSITAP